MKILLIIATVLLCGLTGNCQEKKSEYIQAPTFGVHFFLADFSTASHIRSTSLGTTIREKKFARLGDMSPGLAVNYQQGLSNTFDVSLMLGGSFLDYPRQDTGYLGQNNLLLEGDVSIRAKLWGIRHRVNPYIQAGTGISKYRGYWGAFIPAGIGMQANILGDIYLLANAQYRIPVTSNVSHHFFYSIGITGIIGKKTEQAVKRPPSAAIPQTPPSDRDHDGIIDRLDDCPDVPGMAQFNGCPDRDGDGIPDLKDSCAQIFGLLRYQGCPIPDTDQDGFNDEIDSCKLVPGVARYRGCPAPDRDGDGVDDALDKCPYLPGAGPNGCPELKESVRQKVAIAARNIFFASGSHRLLPSSHPALDEVARLLQEDPALQLHIIGHTDYVGTNEKNQLLSEQRAKAVLDYLVKKGVKAERLQSAGYGEERPVADNETIEGRRENRRVEMWVRY